MSTEKLYPDLTGTVDSLDSKLSKARATEIINKQKELEKEPKHYKKLRHNWKHAGNVFRIVGITAGGVLTAASGVAAGVASAGIAVPIVVPTVLACVGVTETMITQSVAFGYIRKKKHRFSEKYDLVNTSLNRLYHFYHRAVEDKVISLEEIDEFHKLVKEYEDNISKLQSKDTDNHSFKKLEHLAEVEAKKQCEKEVLEKLTEEKKNNLKSQFNLN